MTLRNPPGHQPRRDRESEFQRACRARLGLGSSREYQARADPVVEAEGGRCCANREYNEIAEDLESSATKIRHVGTNGEAQALQVTVDRRKNKGG